MPGPPSIPAKPGYHARCPFHSNIDPMALLEDVVARQADGARFVISYAQLGMTLEAFDAMVQPWLTQGGPGFTVASVPHRKCVDGAFFIDRVTVLRLPGR